MTVVFLLFAVPLCAAAQGGTVEGIAYNRLTKAPVPGISVALRADGEDRFTTKIDAAGAFRFDGVPAGEYDVNITSVPGYLIYAPNPVRAGEKPVRIELPCIPLGRIRGRVLDLDRRPVRNARVELFRAYGASLNDVYRTDAGGWFATDPLPPARYRLRARPAEPDVVTHPDGSRWIVAPTYFPSGTDLASSETIVVREGAELDGFEIRLREVPVYRLRGTVRPAGGASVQLFSATGQGGSEKLVFAAADGSFEFPAVPAGEWQIYAQSMRDKSRWDGWTPVTMPHRDLDGVVVPVNAPFPFEVAVEGAPAKRIGAAWLVRLFGERAPGPYARAISDDRIRFEQVYPGRYLIETTGLMAGRYLKAVLLGNIDVTGRAFDLAASSAPLRLVFAENAPRVAGTVENGAGAWIVFTGTARDGPIHLSRCDSKGRFLIEGVGPGSWHAFAFDTVDHMNSDAIRYRVFDRGLSRTAEVIRLREGETVDLKLRLSPWFE